MPRIILHGHTVRSFGLLLLLLLVILVVSGCTQLGPGLVKAGRNDYNKVLAQTDTVFPIKVQLAFTMHVEKSGIISHRPQANVLLPVSMLTNTRR